MPLGSAKINSLARYMAPTRTALTVTRAGSTVISTAQSKIGSSSAYFDGTGDYLEINSSTLQHGTNNFTLECWFRTNSSSKYQIIFDQRDADSQVAPTIYMPPGNTLLYFVNGSTRITGGVISTGTWYHIALSRSGSSTKLFINGTQSGSTYTDNNNYINKPVIIGNYKPNLGATVDGYIDELRISNSARYTSNFTAPTTAFVNDENTLLLLHFEGSNNSTTFTDDNT